MCENCGCGITPSNRRTETIEFVESLLSENDEAARHNREHLDAHGVFCINLMSSPGSGKTTLIEQTIEALGDRVAIGVIEGDLETENDALRIRARGVPAVQIETGTACHLDARLVHEALHELPLEELDLLLIENVGNLVCPASFDLGQHLNVALLAVTEGDDKAAKYPVMFRAADAVVLTKCDLLGVLDDFDPVAAEYAVRNLGSNVPILRTAARREVDAAPWFAWLERWLVASSPDSAAEGS